MSTRHRVPTVFTLYMVDVLCCALGCVIFLWFLKLHEAHLREKAAAQTSSLLYQTRAQLDETNRTVIDTRSRLRAAEDERDRVRRDRDSARARLTDLEKQLADTLARASDAEDRLAKKEDARRDLAKRLRAARDESNSLQSLLRLKEGLAKSAAQSADELAGKLRDAESQIKDLQPQADQVPGLRDELRISREKLAALELRAGALDKEVAERKKELAGADRTAQSLEDENRRLTRELSARTRESGDASRTIEALQLDKRQLADQMNRVRAASENRFAGITLTGRRVVFLVDMSGSMDLVDERTLAPAKWTGVRESLVKIMRSLPDLEKFQIILFSDNVTYLLGNEDGWLDYDARTSAARVEQALAAIRPKGNTNMYAALEAAFRFRPAGLDTIYLFSDGLPNIGAGLDDEAARNMREAERADILGKYIRRTLSSGWNRDTPGRARVRINAVGFFYESPDVGAFLWALARENDGSFVGMSRP